jgi:cytochrome c oxidase subunit IV
MSHLSYEESKKMVFKGLWILAAVTLLEVVISLFGKGHIIEGMHENTVVFFITGLIIIALSLYKAYFIIYDFMHMRYEVKGLAMSVLLPTVLLIWAIIAFFQEGNAWKSRRQQVNEQNKEQRVEPSQQEGFVPADTKEINKF